jgi:DNA polymerase sliding clamp subunit (PCNA homolog)
MLEFDDLTIYTDGKYARIVNDGFAGAMRSLPVGNFPSLKVPSGQEIVVKSEDFTNAVQSVTPACAIDEKRPALAGVRLIAEPGKITFVATDNARLAVFIIPAQCDLSLSFILPRSALLEMLRTPGDEMTIVLSDDGVTFRVPQLLVTTRPISGKYPDHMRIVPNKETRSETQVIVDREPLVRAVQRVSMLGDEYAPIILDVQEATVDLYSEDRQTHERLEVFVDGPPLEVGLRPQFLLDGLAPIEEEMVTLGMNGPLRPASLRHGPFTYTMMPMKLSDRAVA